MNNDDDLVALTSKDLLLELRVDVRRIAESTTLLTSARLDERLTRIEHWSERVNGRVSALTVGIVVISGVLGLVTGLMTIVRGS